MDASFTLISRQHYGSIFTDFTTAGSWLPKFVLLKERSGLYYFL
jgi:hypothetical protein